MNNEYTKYIGIYYNVKRYTPSCEIDKKNKYIYLVQWNHGYIL